MCDGYDIFFVPKSSTQEGSLFALWTAILFLNLNVRVIRRVKKCNQKVSYFIFDFHMYGSDYFGSYLSLCYVLNIALLASVVFLEKIKRTGSRQTRLAREFCLLVYCAI